MKTNTLFTPEAMFELNATVCDFFNALMSEAARIAQARGARARVSQKDVDEAEKRLLRGYPSLNAILRREMKKRKVKAL